MNSKRFSASSIVAAPLQRYHRFKNGASNPSLMEEETTESTLVSENSVASSSSTAAAPAANPDGQRPKPMIGNINSPSVSMASVSSDEASSETNREKLERMSSAPPKENSAAALHLDGEEAKDLHLELGKLTEVLVSLRRAPQDSTSNRREEVRKVTTERLGEMLKVLRPLLDRFPVLQSDDVMSAASHLIDRINFYTSNPMDYNQIDFYQAIDRFKVALSDTVSEYIVVGSGSDPGIGFESGGSHAQADRQVVFPNYGDHFDDHELDYGANIFPPGDLDFNKDTLIVTVDQVDAVLMRHDRGVDLALDRAKIWSKYAKDVQTYVEKRMDIELEWVKNLAKLAQERRPVLKEESHLPFQSVYCIALDVDLEMCTKTQQTCSLLQDCKFVEPLKQQRAKHENVRKNLRDKWNKERKRIQYAVIQLRKAKELYNQRHLEYERCHEAVRIAEQGVEIGATTENKVEKRKRLQEEALQKATESEAQYRIFVDEANERHRNLLLVKTEILRDVRELIVECDRVMKEVTVNYFQHMHGLLDSLPTQYLTLCENSRLYEPGNQFLEYVRRMPPPDSDPSHSPVSDPFRFEPVGGGEDSSDRNSSKRTKTISLASLDSASRVLLDEAAGEQHRGGGCRREAWTPSMGAIDPSDSDVESERSSPSGSPLVGGASAAYDHGPSSSTTRDHRGDHSVIYFDEPTDLHHGRSTDVRGYLMGTSSRSMPDHVDASGPSDHRGHGQASSSSTMPTSPTTPPRKIPMSNASLTHRFRKVKTPAKCRECETIIMYFNGYECHECGYALHKKCLEYGVLNCGHQKMPRKMPFGQELNSYPKASGSYVPVILNKCVEAINHKGLDVQGIYRVSAAQKKIEKLTNNLESSAEGVDFGTFQPHVIADVLKNFLRQLSEPLLTYHLCPEFIQLAEAYSSLTPSPQSLSQSTLSSSTTSSSIVTSATASSSVASANSSKENRSVSMTPGQISESATVSSTGMAPLAVAEPSNSPPLQQPHLDEEQRLAINKLRDLCRKLPKTNYFTLGYLMHHLGRVSSNSDNNSMTAYNLAIVFAPNLLRSNIEIKDIKDIGAVDGTKNHFRVIELLIQHATLIFGPLDAVAPRKESTAFKGDHHHHHHHRGPRGPRGTKHHRGSRSGAGTVDSCDLISSQTERRGEVPPNDDFNLPGLVSSEEQVGGSSEDIFGASVSEDEDDPDLTFMVKSQERGKASPPPFIIKASLKNFSGLEGVTPNMLSTQDSLEVAQRATNLNSTTASAATAKRTVHHESSMPVASEVSTAVFHKVNQKKKHSIDDEILNNPADRDTEADDPSGIQLSSTASSTARSGSLSEEVSASANATRRSRGTTATSSNSSMSQSMPTTTILNLEENRVTIQVPGVQPTITSVQPRTSNHSTVIKQSSIEKELEGE